jgi:hypothetical protein
MAKRPPVRWFDRIQDHDFAAAGEYLSLVMPPQDAERYRQLLAAAAHTIQQFKAKDILRASGLPVLPRGNVHVAKDLAKIAKGQKISPVLLVRGNWTRPLLIADGYHRCCAVEHYSEDEPVACVLI